MVFVASSVANLSLFVFHVIISRRLGVNAYGTLYAVLSLVQLASLPAGILTTVISKVSAELHASQGEERIRALMAILCRAFGVAWLGYIALGFLFGPILAQFIGAPFWLIPMAAAISGGAILVAILRALFQGTQQFSAFSISLLIDGGVKAIAGPALVMARFGIAGAIWGFFAGVLASLIYTLARLWRIYAAIPVAQLQIDWRRMAHTVIGASVLTISIMTLSYADVVLVKHYFSAHDAGIYSAASLGGKILYFLVSFAPLVLIPKTAHRENTGKNPFWALVGALAMVSALSLSGLAIFFAVPNLVIRVLVGTQYLSAVALLPLYGLAMTLLAFTNVINSYAVALHRYSFSIPLGVATVAEIGSIVLYHPSLHAVVVLLLCGNAVALFFSAAALGYSKKMKP